VPTAFCGPGFDGGGQIKELVSLIDLPPTLLDAAGIAVPDVMEGQSIMPLLRREKAEWPKEVFIQISESCVGRAIRTKRWKYAVVAPDKDGREYMDSDCYQEEYLYDLKADPYELNNLIGLQPYKEVTKMLRKRLIRRMVEAGEEAPDIIPAPERVPREMTQPYWWRAPSLEESS
jgi:arylsulfatase A-like enzyme